MDAPTSRLQQIQKLLGNVKEILLAVDSAAARWNFSLILDIGARVDILSPLMDVLKVNFANHGKPFTLMCTTGSEGGSGDASSFLIVLQSKSNSHVKIPLLLPVNRCTAFTYEQLRLRCCDPKCKLRPAARCLQQNSCLDSCRTRYRVKLPGKRISWSSS